MKTTLLSRLTRPLGLSLLALSLGSTAVSAQTLAKPTKVTTPTIGTKPISAPTPAEIVAAIQRRFQPDFSRTARLSRPTLVVLIHGGTSAPQSSPSLFEPSSPSNRPSTRPGNLGYSRFYWDFPFVAQTLGRGTSSSVFTLDGTELNAGSWKVLRTENNNINNRITLPRNPAATRGNYNGMAAGLVRLNGSVAIGSMAKQALDEIRLLKSAFEDYAGREPYVVLVGHSKGGLVIRYLLSVPQGTVAGHNLSEIDEDFLRELRNDVKFAVTIASPHTGSPLADYGQDLRNNILSTQNTINAVWSTMRSMAAVVRINLQANPPLDLTPATQLISGGADDLGHLTTEFWNTMNNGPLHPQNMARSDGRRIPLYLYGGRAPGDNFFSTARFDGRDVADFAVRLASSNENTKLPAFAAMGLMGLDYALHNAVGGDWGRILAAGNPRKNLDMVRRAYPKFGLPRNTISAPGERMFLLGVEGMQTFYLRNQPDRETDCDGMVSIDSALGIGLFAGPVAVEGLQTVSLITRQAVPQVVLEPWERNLSTAPAGEAFVGGSWYRMYSGSWNFQNHSTQTKRSELGTEINRVLRAAGPFASRAGALSIW